MENTEFSVKAFDKPRRALYNNIRKPQKEAVRWNV